MIEKLDPGPTYVHTPGESLRRQKTIRKLNEVIDAVNGHASRLGEVEEFVYYGPDDDYDDDELCLDCQRLRPEPIAFFVTEDDGPLYEVVKRYKQGG